MVSAIYLALSEAPLGVVSAILMLGPLTVSALGSRGPIDLACVALAAVGVAILTLSYGTAGPISAFGITSALVAAAAFGAYIHAGKRVAKEFDGSRRRGSRPSDRRGPPGAAGPRLRQARDVGALDAGRAYGRRHPCDGHPVLARGDRPAEPVRRHVRAAPVVRARDCDARRICGPWRDACRRFSWWASRWSSRPAPAASDHAAGRAESVPIIAPSWPTRRWLRSPGCRSSAGCRRRISRRSPRSRSSARSPAGTVLTEQGQAGDEFFIVADGEVEIRLDGREIRRLGPGDYLGEIALVFGGKRTAPRSLRSPLASTCSASRLHRDAAPPAPDRGQDPYDRHGANALSLIEQARRRPGLRSPTRSRGSCPAARRRRRRALRPRR